MDVALNKASDCIKQRRWLDNAMGDGDQKSLGGQKTRSDASDPASPTTDPGLLPSTTFCCRSSLLQLVPETQRREPLQSSCLIFFFARLLVILVPSVIARS